jgi:hypothetical protein
MIHFPATQVDCRSTNAIVRSVFEITLSSTEMETSCPNIRAPTTRLNTDKHCGLCCNVKIQNRRKKGTVVVIRKIVLLFVQTVNPNLSTFKNFLFRDSNNNYRFWENR